MSNLHIFYTSFFLYMIDAFSYIYYKVRFYELMIKIFFSYKKGFYFDQSNIVFVIDIFLTHFFWANLREKIKLLFFHFGYLFYYSLINGEKLTKNGRNLYINHLTYLALIYAEDIRERERDIWRKRYGWERMHDLFQLTLCLISLCTNMPSH